MGFFSSEFLPKKKLGERRLSQTRVSNTVRILGKLKERCCEEALSRPSESLKRSFENSLSEIETSQEILSRGRRLTMRDFGLHKLLASQQTRE